MCPVDTTVSITHASTRPRLENAWRALPLHWLRALACVVVLYSIGWAHAGAPEVVENTLQRNADTLHLSARLNLVAPPGLQDALLKGVPMYFVWRAEVYRDRWYWADKRVNTTVRTLRLAYQPLTRRWRLSVSNDAGAHQGVGGLRYALHQSFDQLDDVLAVIGRATSWPIADATHWSSDDRYRVEWRFRLELSLLPRPFQIGMVNDPDWVIDVERQLDVPAAVAPTAAAPDPASADGPVAPTLLTPSSNHPDAAR